MEGLWSLIFLIAVFIFLRGTEGQGGKEEQFLELISATVWCGSEAEFINVEISWHNLEVSLYNVYTTNQFQTTFAQEWGVGEVKLLNFCPNYVQKFAPPPDCTVLCFPLKNCTSSQCPPLQTGWASRKITESECRGLFFLWLYSFLTWQNLLQALQLNENKKNVWHRLVQRVILFPDEQSLHFLEKDN